MFAKKIITTSFIINVLLLDAKLNFTAFTRQFNKP